MLYKKLFADKAFYGRVLAITIPIMIQNGITNFVNMLDNIMVGSIGTPQMTGVAVSNQLLFVFNLCVFGAISGAGIFSAQFHGYGDHKGVRDTFRFKVLVCLALTLGGIALFSFAGDGLINIYLSGEGEATDAAASLSYGRTYLNIMLIGLLPYALAQCYSGTLRETGETKLPMYAGIVAVAVNLSLNYVLMFVVGWGVVGAAVATVVSRFVELSVVALWTHTHTERNPFIIGALRSLSIPLLLAKNILKKGMPLMINESLWAGGMAALNACYSVRGLDVVAANNICQTFFNVFSVAFLAVGVAVGIILGQMLGAGDNDGAMACARKLITFSVVISIGVGALYAVCTPFIPMIYNTTESVRTLAAQLMLVSAIAMPIDAFANAAYFTLRSGGKTFITFLFDSCFVWSVSVVAAFLLVNYTSLDVVSIFAVCQGLGLLKCALGYVFVKKGIWVRNIVA